MYVLVILSSVILTWLVQDVKPQTASAYDLNFPFSHRNCSRCINLLWVHRWVSVGLFWQRKKWLCDWSSIALFCWDRALLAEKEVTVWLKQHRTLPLGSGSSGNWTLVEWCWCLDWCCCCKLLHVSLSHTTLMLLMNLSNMKKVSLQWVF